MPRFFRMDALKYALLLPSADSLNIEITTFLSFDESGEDSIAMVEEALLQSKNKDDFSYTHLILNFVIELTLRLLQKTKCFKKQGLRTI